MEELTIQERIKKVQAKIKNLSSNRDKVFGDARVEEQKLKQSYAALIDLGIENPEEKTSKELRALEEKSKEQLEQQLEAIETQVATGEELMKKYNELQES